MLVDKPSGPTSHDVGARVRRLLGMREVGHAGTLDPFATGLLVVLTGRATRLARFAEQQEKTYRAIARLGVVTSTDDLTGEPLPGGPDEAARPERGEVQRELHAMVGRQLQRPPAFSAKRVGGERSYRLARRGKPVELAPVEVEIHAMELLDYAPPLVTFRTVVSPGTYVRAIARDLGERLGCGGHLTELRRERIGTIDAEEAVPLEQLTPSALLPPVEAVRHLPRVVADAAAARAIGYGQRPPLMAPDGTGWVAVVDEAERLLAVGKMSAGRFEPQVVLEAAG
jgi:tRNA pseudouridine55 synthase